MQDVFLLTDGLEAAVGALVYVVGIDIGVLCKHVCCENGGLDGRIGAVLAFVHALLSVHLLVSAHSIMVAGTVVALVARVRLGPCKQRQK